MLQKKLEQQEEELRKLSIHIEQEQPSAAELPDLGWLQAQQQMASLEEEVSTNPFPIPGQCSTLPEDTLIL